MEWRDGGWLLMNRTRFFGPPRHSKPGTWTFSLYHTLPPSDTLPSRIEHLKRRSVHFMQRRGKFHGEKLHGRMECMNLPSRIMQPLNSFAPIRPCPRVAQRSVFSGEDPISPRLSSPWPSSQAMHGWTSRSWSDSRCQDFLMSEHTCLFALCQTFSNSPRARTHTSNPILFPASWEKSISDTNN